VAFVADLKALSDQQQSQIVAKDLEREVQLTGAKPCVLSAACHEYQFVFLSISGDAEFVNFVEKLSDVAIPASRLPVVRFVP